MDKIIEKLDFLQDLYVNARRANILLENYDRDRSSYIGIHNELRNALDHIMRMIQAKGDAHDCEKEFRGAESHLLRASYDAYELVCISQINYIKQTLAIYSTNDINIGFPDYYKEIKPDILDIENETARIREVKRQKSVGERATYEYYFNAAEKLINYVKQIDKHISIIDECYTERLKKERLSKAGFIVGIVGVIIGIAGIIVALI
ncbi:hypothetical protein AGMMS49965_21880 [Bacteroidia bacterium]|nr:hypothetical protein AGMMS49965_21880 [Bacteroidia bacterium]